MERPKITAIPLTSYKSHPHSILLLWARNDIGKSTFALMVEAVRTGIGTILSCSTNTRIDITGPERGRNPSGGPTVSRPLSPCKDFCAAGPDLLHGRASSWLYGEKLNVLCDFLFIQTEKEKRDERINPRRKRRRARKEASENLLKTDCPSVQVPSFTDYLCYLLQQIEQDIQEIA